MILQRLQSWALMALAIVLVLIGAYAMGGRAAAKSAKQRRDLEEAQRAAAGAKGVHDAQMETQALRDGGAADQLRADWVRDDDPK